MADKEKISDGTEALKEANKPEEKQPAPAQKQEQAKTEALPEKKQEQKKAETPPKETPAPKEVGKQKDTFNYKGRTPVTFNPKTVEHKTAKPEKVSLTVI